MPAFAPVSEATPAPVDNQPRADAAPATATTVLIAGAGPAGLFAACELVRHGITPRIVDRMPAPHHQARGTVLQPAALATLERAGLIAPFLAAGVHIRHIQILGPGLTELAREHFADAGGTYPFQCALPQWRTETIFRDHLHGLGLDVEYGTEVIAVEDEAQGLRVTLERGGRREIVAARYLLGAGGAHSAIRHSMHEHLGGETYGGRYFVADAALGLPIKPEYGRVIVGPTGFLLLSPLPENRRLIFVNRDEDDAEDTLPDAAALGRLLDARASAELGLHDLRWVSPFRMHKRVVPRLADGRRFLLGDEAHLSSPLGGEGLNSALMDAADIAWKLALAIGGRAQPSLLDSFVVERGLADHHVLEVSDEVHAVVMGLVATYRAGGVPNIPPATPEEHARAVRRRLMLDVSYAGSTLIAAGDAAAGGPQPGERFPTSHRLTGTSHHLIAFGPVPRLDELRAGWGDLLAIVDGAQASFDAEEAGLPDGGAILVRPDGFIGFRAAPADAAAIDALHAHMARYLISVIEPAASAQAAVAPAADF